MKKVIRVIAIEPTDANVNEYIREKINKDATVHSEDRVKQMYEDGERIGEIISAYIAGLIRGGLSLTMAEQIALATFGANAGGSQE